jgi:hypothetical protein
MNYITNDIDCKNFLNKVSDTYSGSEAPIKWEFCQSIIDELEFDFSNPYLKILIPKVGFGTLYFNVYLKLKEHHSDSHIFENMLFGMEETSYRISLLKTKLPMTDTSVCKGEFLSCNIYDNKEFDLIIMNPPFDKNRDYLYIQKGFSMLNKNGVLVSIHKGHALLSKKRIFLESRIDVDEKRILDIISQNYSKIRFIDGRVHVSKVLDRNPLAISYIQKTGVPSLKVRYEYMTDDKNYQTLKSIDDIWMHGNSEYTQSILQKVLGKGLLSIRDNVFHNKPNRKTGYYLVLAQIASNFPSKQSGFDTGYYCLISKRAIHGNEKIIYSYKDTAPNRGQFIHFNTKTEAVNCSEFLICKFGRFLVSLYKTNGNFHRGELEIIPNLDFTRKWTSKQLYRYFKLNDAEIEFIENYIANWYDFDYN